MRIIVRIVRGWKGIGMDVPRSLIWGVHGRICSMRRRGWGRRGSCLKELDDAGLLRYKGRGEENYESGGYCGLQVCEVILKVLTSQRAD